MLLELHMLLQHLLLPEHPWPAWKQGTQVGPSQIRPAQQLSGVAVQATPCIPQPPSVPVSLPEASCEASFPPASFPAEASVAPPLDEPPPLLDALPLEPPAPLELAPLLEPPVPLEPAPPLELLPPPELTPPLELPPAASEPELSTPPEEPQAAPSTPATASTKSRRNVRFMVWRPSSTLSTT